MNIYSEDLEHEATTAHCTKCGEEIIGSEDSICPECAGEEPIDFSEEELEELEKEERKEAENDMTGASDNAEYPDR